MKTQRIRDAIYDIIVFESGEPRDMAAWRLLQTFDFQRLRRIKQLGVSEFVFPSASHSRFAHSVGVFHNARRLVKLIEREITLQRVHGEFDPQRARIAMFAALLHDIGHGPFSHAFEQARKSLAAGQGVTGGAKTTFRRHEAFTADMIKDPSGQIGAILADASVHATDVADLIAAEIPADMYHAVVSSSFDADRLDYLLRDRYMTGTGAGAIDIEWLMDNVRVAAIDFSPPDANGGDPIYQHSFCLGYKAREAAEDFLLARYRLYTNVYLHKTTRGIEQLVSALFRLIARCASANSKVPGLAVDHPLLRFFASGGGNLVNYRALDDTVIWGAMHSIAASGEGELRGIAHRILNREKPICLDVQQAFPEEPELQRRLKHQLDAKLKDKLGHRVFRDTARLSIYGEVGADDRRAQKRLMIQMADGRLKEITDFKDATIAASERQRTFERYYFLDEADHKVAQNAIDSVRGRGRTT